MDELKLVSVRLSNRDLAVIDEYCKTNPFYVKSDVIRQAVSLAAALILSRCLGKVMRFHPHCDDVLDEFELKYHREVK